jgi:hypothetical protein
MNKIQIRDLSKRLQEGDIVYCRNIINTTKREEVAGSHWVKVEIATASQVIGRIITHNRNSKYATPADDLYIWGFDENTYYGDDVRVEVKNIMMSENNYNIYARV